VVNRTEIIRRQIRIQRKNLQGGGSGSKNKKWERALKRGAKKLVEKFKTKRSEFVLILKSILTVFSLSWS
jgi:hypothetical protein